MAQLYLKIQNIPLLIIPDTQAHMNGHSIITFTYSIFNDTGEGNPLYAPSKENTLHMEDIDDPNYYGYITFEQPGRSFSYTAGSYLELNGSQVEEIIEYLSQIRDNPSNWQQLDKD
jgi:hypothetical protein